MSLWDLEAAGNAAVYLRLSEMAMLEIRNAPFAGASQVWVPVSECGYMKAEVTGKGDKPNTTKCLRADGKEKTYADDKIDKQNPPKYELLEGTSGFILPVLTEIFRFGKHDLFVRSCCCLQLG